MVAALPQASDRELEDLATVLSWLPFDGVDEVLGSLLPHDGIRRLAAEALAKRGERGVSVLLAALTASEVEVRKSVVMALGHSGSQRAVPALVTALARITRGEVPGAVTANSPSTTTSVSTCG